ncbi:MAG: methyltransferase, CheR-type [Hyphomicrobiales bacterium]|nr:methyltransferase, CheR-type [Hyphomicrobiales bacterium]
MTDVDGLSAADLKRLCDFLYRRTGMMFGESKRYYIDRRVGDRMEQTGARTFGAYLAQLRDDPFEAEHLINNFTVNETYFYREEYQLRALSRDLLPEIVARRQPGDKVRIWSAPCATGEEPYSIAIWLLENWDMVDAYNIEIVGSDIDTRVIAAALEGDYRERALSRLPEAVRRRYFEREGAESWRLIRDIKESVTFTQVNLIDPASVAMQEAFDVIFCRNLFIYFDDASRLLAANNLFATLNPGGFVCLGHTEFMLRALSNFTCRRFEEAVVYQRPWPPGSRRS